MVTENGKITPVDVTGMSDEAILAAVREQRRIEEMMQEDYALGVGNVDPMVLSECSRQCAVLYRSLRNNKDARRFYRRAISTMEDCVAAKPRAEFCERLYAICLEAGEFEESVPSMPGAKLCYLKAADSAQQLAKLTQAKEAHRSRLEMTARVAMINQREGLLEEAEMLYGDCRKIAEGMAAGAQSAEAYQAVARIYLKIADVNVAQKDFEKARLFYRNCCEILELLIYYGDAQAAEELERIRAMLQTLPA